MQKLRWWKRTAKSFWVLFFVLPYFVILIILGVLAATGFAETHFFFEYMIVTASLIAFAYYIRTTSSLGLWRAIWIMVGVSV
ncbi:MAG: hypothetical protein QHH18_05705 [Candidatus Bathyarchaeota archaeon]|nr:hypothetical protein [Candidatus Bathyarchaeota archaeon A05DMB-5]MDH7558084.1 hypothetical protein [Candidatus Bathyarchaeota archaeon]